MTALHKIRPILRNGRLSLTPNSLFMILAVLGLVALLLERGGAIGFDDWWSLLPLCLAGMAILLFAAFLIVRTRPQRALYDSRIYMALSGAVYYAFGPLLYLFGSTVAIRDASTLMPVNAAKAFEITGLNLGGLGLSGLVFSAVDFPRLRGFTTKAGERLARIHPFSVWLFFLATGLAAQLLWVLPYQYGLQSTPSPGPINVLAGFVDMAILLGWYLVIGGRRSLLLPMLSLTGTELLIALTEFNKTELLLIMIMTTLGVYLARPRTKKLAVGAGVVLLVYLTAIPAVNYGRDYLSALGGGAFAPAGFDLRTKVLGDYYAMGGGEIGGQQGNWWQRFNYLPPQRAAMLFYDQGNGGHDYQLIPWIFVPRLLYPAKPSMTQSAIDFTYKLNGTRTSSTGIGIFIDGYYNLGWWGLLAAACLYGFCMKLFSTVGRVVIEQRSFLLLPLSFSAIYLGVRTDGAVLSDVLGTGVLFLATLLMFAIASRLMLTKRSRR